MTYTGHVSKNEKLLNVKEGNTGSYKKSTANTYTHMYTNSNKSI